MDSLNTEGLKRGQLCESTYRRGYTQGYSAAMDAIQTLLTPEQWEEWCRFFDRKLMTWRYKGLSGGFFAPEYEIRAKRSE